LNKAAEENMWPAGLAAVKFLLLTGWRRGEAATLRRRGVNLPWRTAILGDTKTGQSIRPLSTACGVLAKLTSTNREDRVFPASRGAGLMAIENFWDRIAELGKLPPGITPHTLRHSFASVAGDLQYSSLRLPGSLAIRVAR
jgi:integrase